MRVPYGAKDKFYNSFNALPETERFATQKVEHRVKKGENLSTIASKYRVLISDLMTINNLKNDRLQIGQRLKIPVKGGIYSNYPEKISYSVKKGDTLGAIAERYICSAELSSHGRPGEVETKTYKREGNFTFFLNKLLQ